jgi:hypothetical protein
MMTMTIEEDLLKEFQVQMMRIGARVFQCRECEARLWIEGSETGSLTLMRMGLRTHEHCNSCAHILAFAQQEDESK